MPIPISEEVRKWRDALRSAGLRPIRARVFDARLPGFAVERRRQCQIAAAADAADCDLDALMDAAVWDAEAEV